MKTMKARKLKISRILCISFMIIIATAAGGYAQEISDTLAYNYKVDEFTEVEFSNKYGNIHVNTWEKDSLKVLITRTSKGSTEEQAASRLEENLKIDVVETRHYIAFETNVDIGGYDLLNEIKGVLSLEQNNSKMVNVDYKVWMPATLDLVIDNKFGDIYLPDLEGEVSIDHSYGKLLSHDFGNKINFNLKYSDARLNKLRYGKINLNSSELEIKEAGSLIIDSHSSTIQITQCDDLRIDSSHDDIQADQVNTAELNTNFSDVEMKSVGSSVYASSRYGTLVINLWDNNFDSINIQSDFTDITINAKDPSVCFFAEIEHQRGRLMYPASATDFTEKAVDKSESHYISSGNFGQCKNPELKVSVKINSSEFKLIKNF